MSEDRVIRNMRHMAWERAKGEMKSMLHTFWDEEEKFEDFDARVKDFINTVESDGLHE